MNQLALDFSGKTYDPAFDRERLGEQMQRVYSLMVDGTWRTLAEIEQATGDPQASVSARLRDLRKKPLFLTVERRPRGDRGRGLYEYRIMQGRK